MTHTIVTRWTGAVIWSGEAETMRDAVRLARASGSDLRGSDLSDSDLSGSNLSDSDLRGSNLRGSDLTPIRDDLWAILSGAPAEVPGLIAAIKAGQIDGSTYSGECACLVGTLAHARGCAYDEIETIAANGARPAERFFACISPGQTPQTHEPSRIALRWCEEWLARMRAAFGGAA